MRFETRLVLGTVLGLLLVTSTRAADLGVAAKKLVIVDKLVAAGKAKAVFVAGDLAVTKGSGTDVGAIGLELFFGYQGTASVADGRFTIPTGANDGIAGWTANKETVAKFVNKDAPAGSTGVKVAAIKPAATLKVVGKTLGDVPIDLVGAGAPVTDVCVAAIVTNGPETTRLCTRFPIDAVAFSSIAGDTGRKLVAKDGLPDAGCLICGGGLPTTTTSTTSTSTSSTSSTSTSVPSATSSSTTSSTSTSLVSSSTTSSTAVTVTTTSTTTSTIIPALCGNGTVNAGETCDDGNNNDNDNCPANCVVAACTPLTATTRQVTVAFAAPPGVDVAALTLLMNYPEQKVFMPPAGAQTQIGAANFVPLYPASDVLIRGADLTHAVRGLVADSTPVPSGPIFRLIFQDCQGAAAPLPGEFNCRILDASDPSTNPVSGVLCGVTLP
jgi:cysteine-rich repeat protein